MLLVAPRVFRAPSGAGLRRGRRPARVMVLLVAPLVFRAPSGAGLRRGRRPARVMVLLVAPLVFRAPEGPAAREARASLRSAPRLEARPGPATAHGHRSQAPLLPTGTAAWLAGSCGRHGGLAC